MLLNWRQLVNMTQLRLLSYRRIYLCFSKFVNAFFFKVVLSMVS